MAVICASLRRSATTSVPSKLWRPAAARICSEPTHVVEEYHANRRVLLREP